jgi:hypothetical protein
MKIHIEFDETTLRKLLYDHICQTLGTVEIEEKDITIEVKASMNYRSEWEKGQFRAIVDKVVT